MMGGKKCVLATSLVCAAPLLLLDRPFLLISSTPVVSLVKRGWCKLDISASKRLIERLQSLGLYIKGLDGGISVLQ